MSGFVCTVFDGPCGRETCAGCNPPPLKERVIVLTNGQGVCGLIVKGQVYGPRDMIERLRAQKGVCRI